MVPTVDTVRVKFIASSLVRVGVHTLLVGGVGVGKTMMASSVLEGLPTGYGAININFSAQTSSNSLQDTIEGKLEKRTKVLTTLAILNLHAAPAMACSRKHLQLLQCCTLLHLHAPRNNAIPCKGAACRNTSVTSVIAVASVSAIAKQHPCNGSSVLRTATCFHLMHACTAALQGVFGPPGGKHLIAFIDDLNMPQKSKFGFIPPLELLKLWVDYGFWYDRERCEAKQIKDMQLMAAMAPPGGGRNAFSQRLQVSHPNLP